MHKNKACKENIGDFVVKIFITVDNTMLNWAIKNSPSTCKIPFLYFQYLDGISGVSADKNLFCVHCLNNVEAHMYNMLIHVQCIKV